jgi:glycosyltransferase involved in cell wall biosynthesis
MKTNADLAVIMAVRNEAHHIAVVLDALERQTAKPSMVVIVDDESTDGTKNSIDEALTRYHFRIHPVYLTQQRGTKGPGRAYVINRGLEKVTQWPRVPGYVMKLDGDHMLPDYIERILTRMEARSNIALAGGWIMGEPYDEYAPRGSSMIIRTSFWQRANGCMGKLRHLSERLSLRGYIPFW